MSRRKFISLLGGTIAWPFVARAQQPRRVPRVGYVWIGAPGTDESTVGLRRGLEDRGYVIGRTLMLEERYANGDAGRVPGLIAELLALKVDVLATPGSLISRAAQRATTIVPIVLVMGDPIGAGLVASLAHPGGNITGLSLLSFDYAVKWLELLKEVTPKLHRIAVLWTTDNPLYSLYADRARAAAQALALDLSVLSAQPAELETSLAAINPANLDGFVVPDDPFLETIMPRLITLAAERKLPAIYGFSAAVRQGALMSYSADFFALWREAAGYIDRILKGALPADLPIEQATKVSLKINLKTAMALGIELPPPLLARADEVVE
ncbi:ABC transporter substrate-binding protein [Bradyrhizobium tropiciagri]|uniref:ABC transporter substrate-binding protein n=1 Tax=Bradyrhizobium tropiciagri TaxID=312253 RepID=UPI00067B74FE|nr:ABC transporter substrate-binding protein [Bradyrhizobium tropiciagri]